jgi:hypothetical protein
MYLIKLKLNVKIIIEHKDDTENIGCKVTDKEEELSTCLLQSKHHNHQAHRSVDARYQTALLCNIELKDTKHRRKQSCEENIIHDNSKQYNNRR